jgi:hypothetical protein
MISFPKSCSASFSTSASSKDPVTRIRIGPGFRVSRNQESAASFVNRAVSACVRGAKAGFPPERVSSSQFTSRESAALISSSVRAPALRASALAAVFLNASEKISSSTAGDVSSGSLSTCDGKFPRSLTGRMGRRRAWRPIRFSSSSISPDTLQIIEKPLQHT